MGKNFKQELTEKDVLAVFGQPKEIKNGEWIYPCQLCKDEGADSDSDHLKINISKGCITCFASPEHTKELNRIYRSFINARKRVSTSAIDTNPEQMKAMQKELSENAEVLELLKSKGYNDFTIKQTGIGLYKGDWFTIPMYSIDDEFVGYEFRYDHNYKHSHKTKGYVDNPKNALCKVHGYKTSKFLLLMAGFKDGHIMFQYLQENGLLDDYSIVTASNGEPNTLKALSENLNYVKKFKKVILCLDKDTTGKASSKKIAQELGIPVYELSLPFIENDKNKSFKDFADWYNLAKENDFDKPILPRRIKLIPESLLSSYIHSDDDFDKPKFFTNSKEEPHELANLLAGVYSTKYGYYSISHKNNVISLKRKSNFIFKVTRKVISSSMKFEVEKSHKVEFQTLLDGKLTKPVIMPADELTRPESIKEKLRTTGIHFSCLTTDELKSVLYNEYRNCERSLNVFENPGIARIKDKSYWLYSNACYDIKEDMLIESEKDSSLKQGVLGIENQIEIALNPPKGMKTPNFPNAALLDLNNPKYKYLQETAELYKDYFKDKPDSINILTASLIRNTLSAYKNSIEPFIIIGNAIMSPFTDIVYEQLKAYPVSYGHGEARSGKSNILELIAKLFGYNASFISGGNDTSKNVMHNMEHYNKTPLLYAEVEGNIKRQFSENIKAFYDRTPRKIMKGYGKEQEVKAINSTIHFTSNDMLPNDEQTMSRLLFCEFKQNNFDFKKAIPFNEIRDDLIGLILPEILFYLNKPEYIQKLIELNDKKIELINLESKTLNIDTRSRKNIAVAMTGIDLLFETANLDKDKCGSDIQQMQANLIEYLHSYAEVTETKDHFLTFMEILTEMFKQSKLTPNQDYVFNSKGLAIYLKSIMPSFRQTLKITGALGEYCPKETEIKISAKKYGCTDEVVNFKGKSRRALIIPYTVDGIEFIRSIISGPNEEINRSGEVI